MVRERLFTLNNDLSDVWSLGIKPLARRSLTQSVARWQPALTDSLPRQSRPLGDVRSLAANMNYS
jgi:hypothetical protein